MDTKSKISGKSRRTLAAVVGGVLALVLLSSAWTAGAAHQERVDAQHRSESKSNSKAFAERFERDRASNTDSERFLGDWQGSIPGQKSGTVKFDLMAGNALTADDGCGASDASWKVRGSTISFKGITADSTDCGSAAGSYLHSVARGEVSSSGVTMELFDGSGTYLGTLERDKASVLLQRERQRLPKHPFYHPGAKEERR